MSLIFGDRQLRRTSTLNILVLLLMVFVISGHCATAMAQVSELAPVQQPQTLTAPVMDHLAHCGEMAEQAADQGHDHDLGWDEHCPEVDTPLLGSSSKLSKFDHGGVDLVASVPALLPFARAGPCDSTLLSSPASFTTPPLYYTLCVLRL